MLLKHLKIILGVALIILSPPIFAAQASANFTIRLFNNVMHYNPLHYTVTPQGQAAIRGDLGSGGTNSKAINISATTNTQSVDILITDSNDRTLWQGNVTYIANNPQFNTTTTSLYPNYSLTSSIVLNARTVMLEIQD